MNKKLLNNYSPAEEKPPISNIGENEPALRIKICADPIDDQNPFSKDSDINDVESYIKSRAECNEIIKTGIGISAMSIPNRIKLVDNNESADITIRYEIKPSDHFDFVHKEHWLTATFATALDDSNIYFSPNYFSTVPLWNDGFREGYMVKFSEALLNNPEIIKSCDPTDQEYLCVLFGLEYSCFSGFHAYDYLEDFYHPLLALTDFDKESSYKILKCAKNNARPIDGLFSALIASSIYHLNKIDVQRA